MYAHVTDTDRSQWSRWVRQCQRWALLCAGIHFKTYGFGVVWLPEMLL